MQKWLGPTHGTIRYSLFYDIIQRSLGSSEIYETDNYAELWLRLVFVSISMSA